MIPQAWKLAKNCVLCELKHQGCHVICHECILAFPSTQFPCIGCGLPITDSSYKLCGVCIKDSPITSSVIAPFPFIEPLRSFIHQYKYNGALYLSSALSHLIYKNIKDQVPEVLIPMPMHIKRLQTRGFNHAELLAKHLSLFLKIPYEKKICIKTKNTTTQASLPAEERKTNLTHAFKTLKNNYKHVAIIDDVYTTGATIREITRTLRTAGARKTLAYTVAH